MYRRKVIDIPFADYYFAYAEDVFLSWRILKMGYNL
jgi:GT2 family glycosyltransferase